MVKSLEVMLEKVSSYLQRDSLPDPMRIALNNLYVQLKVCLAIAKIVEDLMNLYQD